MKVTLWNQFSSNHSANFTLVGKFNTPEEAQAGAKEVRRILQSMRSWWQSQPIEIYHQAQDTHTLTPPEQAIKTQYGLTDFQEPLDWTMNTNTDQIVTLFRNWVFLDHAGSRHLPETWSGMYPFDVIFRTLGAEVRSSLETTGSILYANFQWTAPNDSVANTLLSDFKTEYYRDIPFLYVPGVNESFDIYDGAFTQEGLIFNLERIHITWSDQPMEIILEKLIGYLEEMGCTNIQYDFVEDH